MKPQLLSITVFGMAMISSGATIAGITLPKTQDQLELQGAGLLRKGFFFKIYVGALYLAETNHIANLFSDVPKRIDIHYFHHTPKKHMIRVAEKTLRKNLTAEQYEAFLPKIEKLHQAYLNGKKGAVASLVYEPGKGLTYSFKRKIVITIPGDNFANAYFKIWLGDRPSSKTIKKAMLEGT